MGKGQQGHIALPLTTSARWWVVPLVVLLVWPVGSSLGFKKKKKSFLQKVVVYNNHMDKIFSKLKVFVNYIRRRRWLFSDFPLSCPPLPLPIPQPRLTSTRQPPGILIRIFITEVTQRLSIWCNGAASSRLRLVYVSWFNENRLASWQIWSAVCTEPRTLHRHAHVYVEGNSREKSSASVTLATVLLLGPKKYMLV